MDKPKARKITGGSSSDKSHTSTIDPFSAPASQKVRTTWETILYILHQILELPITAVLLGFGFILPELRDWIANFGMGKAFDPARDIDSLEGKVILVTGGALYIPIHCQNLVLIHL
jgi:hypothetical protein